VTHWRTVLTVRRLAIAVPLLLVTALVTLVVAWAVDSARTGDTVGRNVEVAGIDLEAMDRARLEQVAARLSAERADDEVVLSTGQALLRTTAGELGVAIDQRALADEALAARDGGPLVTRPLRWAASFFDTVEVHPAILVDEPTAWAEVARLAQELPPPVEPVLVTDGNQVSMDPGADGQTVDPAEVIDALPAVLSRPAPHVVQVQPVPVPPATDRAAVQAVADDANAVATGPLVVRVEDQETVVETPELRSWLTVGTGEAGPIWSFDPAAVVEDLRPRFSGLGPPQERARFEVSGGIPVLVPASRTVVCCAADSAQRIHDARRAGSGEVVLETTEDDTDDGTAELAGLGITEEVSSFTTNHSCCENRVSNIQRFADLVRGSIIRPGERFSLNEAVGQRTEAKGFLPAGAIADGVLEAQVGGGVSQFATTFFNAAFFAGVDIVEYQSHSLYFSRYPRGREATISWPKPDLVIENTTPYGILVWPTYTDTSITVSFYSTRTVEVEDLGATESAQDQCTRVTTTRQLTWADGRTETDTVFAVYRPAEGLNCRGERTAAASG
jgi:vancomycin resistance protein YoaR